MEESLSVILTAGPGTDVDAVLESLRGLGSTRIPVECFVRLGVEHRKGARAFTERGIGVLEKGSAGEILYMTAGEYILMGSAGDVNPRVVERLWEGRYTADVLVGNRGDASMLGRLASRLLSLGVRNATGSLRLFRRSALEDLVVRGVDLDDPLDTLVRVALGGWSTADIRLPGRPATATARPMVRARNLARLWGLRNSIEAADYDFRAYNSRIPLQRWWQRTRHAMTKELVAASPDQSVLDVGCGSGRMILEFPGAVGVEVMHHKIRFMRRFGSNHLVTGSIFKLPFGDDTFDRVICTEVIEHVHNDPPPLRELLRVLRPNGRLIVSTPDFGGKVWPLIERVYARLHPRGYADEHITHYTRQTLLEEMHSYGWKCVELRVLARSILITAFEKTPTS